MYDPYRAELTISLALLWCHVVITLNGKPAEVQDGCSVEALLRTLNLLGSPCAVEVNADLVHKVAHAKTTLVSGDRIEIVTLVGGG